MEVVEIEESPMSYEDLEHDMEAVVRFFVEGNDRDQSEDESVVWQRLEAKVGLLLMCDLDSLNFVAGFLQD